MQKQGCCLTVIAYMCLYNTETLHEELCCCAQVHLDVKGETLVCASSWWNTAQISGYLGETQKPIWTNLSSKRTEIYREITQIYCGHSADLEK